MNTPPTLRRGSFRAGLAPAGPAGDGIRDRAVANDHHFHGLLGGFESLADRLGHFPGLAESDADTSFAVAGRDERGKRKAPSALDHFCHAIDVDDFLYKLTAVWCTLIQSDYLIIRSSP